ncbi:hypothetical protein GNI_023590 [Gregarina niphandrodes]|uniref:Uncharacterized protein n=1 Tax=Gregarina niphandrodes TaxID=110365 RepID=A0A023BBT5_GRENI|nr:hypothetical protein GNI_023590 [Gregarina niphandrodes]EZG79934.1 hypothetical protein GNI_023590 [Gregarina niphandrodes]|eukprot:XP_011134353.1 hypothetical protein GNI_023590 [Gregarina niphandrodes]
MSSAIQGLKNILLELESYDELQLPPYRQDEVRAAETALASARVDYRALLLHHKMSVEKCIESLERAEISRGEGQGNRVNSGEDETRQPPTVEELKRLCVMPDVALCVMTNLNVPHDLSMSL